eukprot:TRINITY_DN4705_c0_g1_i3.p1 TRINITY_DN4705_c0_g1~~TRINITY_DN4705_c0_g1_i3.p1  ORF type:complete len:290 (-),score=55.90 TRINITY_DN4705_c0_g1_i3:1087-1956(-)
MEEHEFPTLRAIEDVYEKVQVVGQGTYGRVYKAVTKREPEVYVAVKKIRPLSEREGFPVTAIREIKILKSLDHPNVIKLKEIVTSKKQQIYMVLEYMDHDLRGLVAEHRLEFSTEQVKCYMKQLLEGLKYCHENGVLHRDLKASNLLVNNAGILKLADFGLARTFSDSVPRYTNNVITLWFRPPELLLGATQYGPAIDMWSVGCIFVELLTGRPLFPGKSEQDQLDLIFNLCGTPTLDANSDRACVWPEVVDLPLWKLRDWPCYERILRGKFLLCVKKRQVCNIHCQIS